jgi:hypothetical protein
MFLLALLVAVAEVESRSGIHGGISIGLGTAYDLMGVRGEVGTDHLGVFLGTGVMRGLVAGTNSTDSGASVSFGARWYGGIRSGWFLSTNFTYSWTRWYANPDLQTASSPTNPDNLFTAGAVGGYRWLSYPFFIELGAGALWFRHREAATCGGASCTVVPRGGPLTHGWLPDAALGVGFDF